VITVIVPPFLAHPAPNALCAESDPDLWASEDRPGIKEAKKICLRCPLVKDCAQWATDTREPHGVWGALTAHQRERIRTKRATPRDDRRRLIDSLIAAGIDAQTLARKAGLKHKTAVNYLRLWRQQHPEAA